MIIFPLAPDQTIAQMWSNGARGRKKLRRLARKVSRQLLPSYLPNFTPTLAIWRLVAASAPVVVSVDGSATLVGGARLAAGGGPDDSGPTPGG